MFYIPYNTKEVRQAYISEYNDKRDNKVNLLKITNGTTNWHYLAVKRMSGLLRVITSNHNDDFICFNCFHSYTTRKRLKNHERICKKHDFCYTGMPNEDNKILKYIPEEK